MIRDTTWMSPRLLAVEERFRARLEQLLFPELVGEEWLRRWELASDVSSQLADANADNGSAQHAAFIAGKLARLSATLGTLHP
eukprot:6961050-Alexandrium_andersonii.AAC.1